MAEHNMEAERDTTIMQILHEQLVNFTQEISHYQEAIQDQPELADRMSALQKTCTELISQVETVSIKQMHQRAEALSMANEELRLQAAALEAAANGIIIANPQGTIIWCNRAFTQMTGYSIEEVVGENLRLLKSGEHNQAFYNTLWNTILAGKVWHGEMINKRKDGTQYIEEQTITPVLADNGQIDYFVSIKQDITERKNIENELRESEQRLRRSISRTEALAEIAHQIMEVGPDYRALLDTIVRTISQIVGDICVLHLLSEDQQWLDPVAYYHNDPEILSAMKEIFMKSHHRVNEGLAGKVFQTGQPLFIPVLEIKKVFEHVKPEYQKYMKRFSGSSLAIVPMNSQGKRLGTLTLFRDFPGKEYTNEDLILLQNLADRASLAIINVRLYQDLEKSLKDQQTMYSRLVQAEKHMAMSRMMASVAHELNNPIQTIKNCLFLIGPEVGADSDVHDYLDMAQSETRRISHLVEQLRDIYRPSRSVQEQPLNLNEVIHEVHSLLSPHLQHEKVEWRQTGAKELIWIMGVEDQIIQVFLNISLNAIEAMQPEGGILTVHVHTSPQQAAISFTDTGPGIPQENVSKLFEPFFTTKESGTGLGLYICYEIVQQHGGSISLETPSGGGTRFTVWLPNGPAPKQPDFQES